MLYMTFVASSVFVGDSCRLSCICIKNIQGSMNVLNISFYIDSDGVWLSNVTAGSVFVVNSCRLSCLCMYIQGCMDISKFR